MIRRRGVKQRGRVPRRRCRGGRRLGRRLGRLAQLGVEMVSDIRTQDPFRGIVARHTRWAKRAVAVQSEHGLAVIADPLWLPDAKFGDRKLVRRAVRTYDASAVATVMSAVGSFERATAHLRAAQDKAMRLRRNEREACSGARRSGERVAMATQVSPPPQAYAGPLAHGARRRACCRPAVACRPSTDSEWAEGRSRCPRTWHASER